MGESVSKKAFFITLPNDDASIGKKISGTRAFTREEMVKKVKALNGQAKHYKVAEIELPEKGWRAIGTNCVMIPQAVSATIMARHEVHDFIRTVE